MTQLGFPDTLETIGVWDFDGRHRSETFTAHPWPVATVKFPRRIHQGFHGTWIPDTDLRD